MTADNGAARRWPLAVVLAGTLACCLGTARAQSIPGYPDNIEAFDPREVSMLPTYCPYTQYFRAKVPGGNNTTMMDRWYAMLGPAFHHLHHYCFGLMKVNRATLLSRDPSTRQWYLNDAVTEYDYVITRSSDDFVLLPEVITKKGDALLLLNKGPMAVAEYERAIELKKDYWPPYAHLADYYKGAGNPKKARELLEAGLAQAPDAQALKRRLAELDTSGRQGATTKH